MREVMIKGKGTNQYSRHFYQSSLISVCGFLFRFHNYKQEQIQNPVAILILLKLKE